MTRRILTVAIIAAASASPALAQGSYPSQAECAAAFLQAATNARAAANDGILGGCGIAGTKIIARVIRGSTQDVDQDHFMRLRDVTPRSGVIFEAALSLAMNPAALPEARVGGMRLLARQLLGSYGDLLIGGGVRALARRNTFCSVSLALGDGDTTGVEGDPLPADYEAQARTSMESLALAPATDSIVQNGARCLRRYFAPPMIEPLPPASIHIDFVSGTVFRLIDSGTREVAVTFDVAGLEVATESACLPGGAALDERLRVTRRLVSSSDPDDVRAREFRRLPAAADSSVQPVSSDAICAAARDAYDAELPITDRRPGRRVYVIRVGDRYVVEDPTFRVGEFGLVMVLDARFAVLSRSTS